MEALKIDKIVVVGAGLAGTRTCERLRQVGFAGQIQLLGAEDEAPYDRPPLTKAVLDDAGSSTDLGFNPDNLDVEFRRGTSASRLSVSEQVLETNTGPVAYDRLVIATGSDPIRLPGQGAQLVVRTLSEARALRARLTPGTRVVVVGASWIGAEVATAALRHGCVVTCIEAATNVLSVALGNLGERFNSWWNEVDLRTNVTVERVDPGSVLLSDDTFVSADVVVVGVGARPAVEWLIDSGLDLDAGIVVNDRLQAAPNVYAVGDAARWWSNRYHRHLRVEHWDNAAASGHYAASACVGTEDGAYDPIPYFWSDQFGRKIQYVGHHDANSQAIVRETDDPEKWSAVWLDPSGRLQACLAVGRPRDLIEARKLIDASSAIDRSMVANATTSLTASATPTPETHRKSGEP